jgi:hypothetical protein
MPSGYPNLDRPTPANPGAKPRRAKWDITVCAVLLTVGALGWIAAAGTELFILAFTDNCPAATCDANRASSSIMVALSAAAAVIVAGIVLAIIQIVRRRLAWPFAAAALALSIAAEVVGLVGYMAAVGY